MGDTIQHGHTLRKTQHLRLRKDTPHHKVRLWASVEMDAVPGRRTKSYGHGPFRAEPTQDLLAAGVYTLGTPEDDTRRMSSLQ
uniref:Transposase n=1 Tax=Globodera pallida TaxID=36090 RepID=A0A183C3B2_GLOPA